MDVDDAVIAADYIKCDIKSIGVHYDTFALRNRFGKAVAKAFNKANKNTVITNIVKRLCL
jgi:hypothetical protein